MWENPVTLILVPGIAGGFILAWLMFRSRRPASTSVLAGGSDRNGVSPDVINMSRIRVGGIGGLGLVAMAATVAVKRATDWPDVGDWRSGRCDPCRSAHRAAALSARRS